MRKNAEKVIRAFLARKPAQGDSKRTISTDGSILYSYRMPIARHGVCDRTFVVMNREDAPSNTTRSHVDAVELILTTENHAPMVRVPASSVLLCVEHSDCVQGGPEMQARCYRCRAQ